MVHTSLLSSDASGRDLSVNLSVGGTVTGSSSEVNGARIGLLHAEERVHDRFETARGQRSSTAQAALCSLEHRFSDGRR